MGRSLEHERSSQLYRRWRVAVSRENVPQGSRTAHGRASAAAFSAEDATERMQEQGVLNNQTTTLVLGNRLADTAEREQELLDSLASVQERSAAWLSMPRHLRAAIRRLNVMINHTPKVVMVQVTRGARVNPEVMQGVKHFECDTYAEISRSGGISKVKAPNTCTFNHEVFCSHPRHGRGFCRHPV